MTERLTFEDEEVPSCSDATNGASDEELLDAWNLVPYEDPDEKGHIWAQPWQLVSVLHADPDISVASVCLRCGTVRRTGSTTADPETGDRIWRTSYDQGFFAKDIEDAATWGLYR